MFKTEESKVAAVILLTFGLLLLALVFDTVVIIGSTIIFLAILLWMVFASLILKKERGEPQDERSAQCSMAATRNGFVVAVVLLALMTVAAQLQVLPFSAVDVLSTIWGITISEYLLSYLYYKRAV